MRAIALAIILVGFDIERAIKRQTVEDTPPGLRAAYGIMALAMIFCIVFGL